jgi:signal transduction histidine kinase
VGLAAFGTLVSAAVVGTGLLLAGSDLDAANAVRVALWNVLGVVVLGGVLAANLAATAGGSTPAPPFVVGNVLAVGAGAHVVIGVYDARRVRADRLDRERQKLAVLGRVLRHNLRNEATVVLGHGERLREGVTDPELRTAAEAVCRAGETVGSLADRAEELMDIVEDGESEPTRTDVAAVADRVAAAARERFPAATIEVAVGTGTGDGGGGPAGYWAWVDRSFETALTHLVENAVEHNDGDPAVTVRVERRGGRVAVTVRDDGPGIPAVERGVVTGEAEITQLSHGSGLGLWVVQSAVEAGDGELSFAERADGSAVTVTHRAAAQPAG